MKKLSKPQIIALSVASVGAATLIGVGGVHAAQSTTGTSIVDKIASQFNLNKADVQKVFDQNRSEMEAKRTQEATDKLQQAVDAGTITSSQKDMIIAKMAELKSSMASLKDKPESERRDAMKTTMDELRKWASDNKIPENLLRPMGGHGRHGHGGERPFGPPPSDTTDNTSTL